MARFLLTGATGFIGTALVPALLARGDRVTLLTRQPQRYASHLPSGSSAIDSLEQLGNDEVFDGLINLAGAGIADQRWTAARRQVLRDSRIGVTDALGLLLQRLTQPPRVMVSGSAVGYYGTQSAERLLDEEAEPAREFSHELCADWEQAARNMAAQVPDSRLCIARLGVVLGPGGGMLGRLWLPFRLGLGGRLGHGHQAFSWIHRDDVVRALLFFLDDSGCRGTYNLCAPNPVSNREFTRAFATACHRPALCPVPAWAIRLAFGEMGDRLLLHGQAAVPRALQRADFTFQHETIEEALQAVVDA